MFIFCMLIFAATCYFGQINVFNGEQIKEIFIWVGSAYGLANTAPKLLPKAVAAETT